MTSAILYDGTTATPHPVSVRADGDALLIETASGYGQSVPLGQLSRDGEGRDWRFARLDQPGWRLRFAEAPPAELAAHLPGPARYGHWVDRLGLGKAALAFGLVAAGVVAVGYAAPAALAPIVPDRWEENVGDVMIGDFGERRCQAPAGNAALAALAERVEPGATRGSAGVDLAAIDLDLVNAAALPGRHVVFTDGILDKVTNADALAGVMAHELAHVRRRHVTEALLRELGIGALIQLFSGSIGTNAQQLLSLSYTRSNEAEADRDAVAALRRAGIDPRPTADFFRRLDPPGKARIDARIEWLESHPGSEGRARLFAASYDPRRTYRPALDPAATWALLNLCDRPVLTDRQRAATRPER
ncbi:hypothetical protein GCM10022280_02890 [Sphingomonas swuensis]|uniref:Peptidase M48 domain-containing protein n=1 Tax=Sphingomonas swuensis TaxID=977800 RepID=A0ABP7SB97_9SPHN